NVTVAINVNISYMKAAFNGVLYARAREISRNPKISTYTVDITDDEGEVLAIFQGMAYTKKDKIKI
ncbi:MAG: PaaI family thioesterase, partial [Methanobacterium sp.]